MDYAASNEFIVTAQGTKTPAQLTKTYSFGGQGVSRLIQAPVSGTVKMFNADGVTPISGTCDYGTGLFTPANNWPGATAAWTGQFDVWVRFMNDYGAFTAVRQDLLTADIELLEVPL